MPSNPASATTKFPAAWRDDQPPKSRGSLERKNGILLAFSCVCFFFTPSLSHRRECRTLYLIFSFCSVAKNFLNKQGCKRRKNRTRSCRRLPLHFLPPDGLRTLSHQFSLSLVVTHLLRSHRANSRHFAIRRIQTHLANQSDTLAELSAS